MADYGFHADCRPPIGCGPNCPYADMPAAAHKANRQFLGELKGLTSAAETKTPSSSPVLVYVRELSQLEGRQFYVASQVATQLGISVQAVRKYTKNKVCGNGVVPTYKVKFSRNKDADNDKGIIINLYTDEDITLLRQFLDSRKVVYRADEEVSS